MTVTAHLARCVYVSEHLNRDAKRLSRLHLHSVQAARCGRIQFGRTKWQV